MIELKPCPFCGAEAKLYVNISRGVCVRCKDYYATSCGCQTPYVFDFDVSEENTDDRLLKVLGKSAVETVIEMWNRRAE